MTNALRRLEPPSPPSHRAGLSDSTLFQLEAVLPSQYADAHRPSLGPEHRLYLAVLEEALVTLRHGPVVGPYKHGGYHDTVRWLWSDATDWPCCFICVCDVLGLEPGAVRGAMRRRGVPMGFRHATPHTRGPQGRIR